MKKSESPPHLNNGLIVAGPWRGHYVGCIDTGCESTRCTPSFSKAWLDSQLSDPSDIERVLARDQWIALGAEATVEQIARWLERIGGNFLNGLNLTELIRSGAWKDPPESI